MRCMYQREHSTTQMVETKLLNAAIASFAWFSDSENHPSPKVAD